jgi:hypothetical protein
MMAPVHFKLEFIYYLGLSLDKEFEIKLDHPHLPRLVIKFGQEMDDKGKDRKKPLCTAITEFDPPPEIAKQLQDTSASLSTEVKNFLNQVDRRLNEAARKTIRLLQWCQGDAENKDVGTFTRFAYSSDAVVWRAVPKVIYLNPHVGILLQMISDKVVESLRTVWDSGEEEPLAHELFREAASQKIDRPRSCVVMAVAAAEVGLKQLIGNLIPDAKWLADNVPSPPLHQILLEFLPVLPTQFRVGGVIPKVPEELLATVKKAVTMRNQIVHGKSPKTTKETMREILTAIHDCLYIFDCYSGKLWAWSCISYGTKRLIQKELSLTASNRSQAAQKRKK